MNTQKEIRQFEIDFRACKEDDKRKIEGRAIPFMIQSPNREGFYERVLPEAVEGVIEQSDIKLLYNHDNSKGFLARSKKGKGTLAIDVREDGVYFSFEAKNDNLSNYVWERLEAGELDETSFAFTIAEDKWTKRADGAWDRDIVKFERLYDFSVVDNSYYGIENAVKCARFAEILSQEKEENERKLAELEAEEEKRAAEEAAQKAEEEKRAAEEEAAAEEAKKIALEQYYKDLKETYKDLLK